MTTAISGRSRSTVRSDSSPSTTSQPSPAPALPPSCAISPPTSQAGSRPSSASTKAIIPVVVVFPCAPATTIERRSETSSARKSARDRPGDGRIRARDDDLPALRHDRLVGEHDLDAVEPAQVRRVDAVPAADLGSPGAGEERVRREAGAADPDEPETPTLERTQARSAPPRSRRPRAGAPSPASPRASRRAAPGSASSSSTSAGTRSSSGSGTTTAPPPRSKCRAFSVWWSLVACGYGTSTEGVPAAASSQTVPPAREMARSGAASAAPNSFVEGTST